MEKCECFQMFRKVRQESVLWFNVIMDEIIPIRRVTVLHNLGQPNQRILEKKFQRVVVVCKDFELNISSALKMHYLPPKSGIYLQVHMVLQPR
jgi:hypothetical protein